MRRIDVTFDGHEYTFRSNDSGEYLFVGTSENRQISCESGFKSLRRMKSAIRAHLRYGYEMDHGQDAAFPRIAFYPSPYDTWEA